MAEVPVGQPVEHIETIVPGVESIAPTTLPNREPTSSSTDATLAAELANEPNSREIFDRTMNLGESRALSAEGEVGVVHQAEGTINKTLSAQINNSK